MRKCSKCSVEKESIEFNKKSRNKDGLSDYCKQCNKDYHKDHYRNNRCDYLEKERKRRKDLQQWIKTLKETLCCENCGEKHPACLDFHHIDASKKDMGITEMISNCLSKERIIKEIAKCKVWCCKCHRIWHWNETEKMALSSIG